MSAHVIEFSSAPKPQWWAFTKRLPQVRSGGEQFVVMTKFNQTTQRCYETVTHLKSKSLVVVRPCGADEDPAIAEVAITAWIAGRQLGWESGRDALIDEIHNPELRG